MTETQKEYANSILEFILFLERRWEKTGGKKK